MDKGVAEKPIMFGTCGRVLSIPLSSSFARGAAHGFARAMHRVSPTTFIVLFISAASSSSSATESSSSYGLWNCTGIDGSGVVDVTVPLQRCITDAYARRLALYLPCGRYLVSAPLVAKQTPEGVPGGVGAGINIAPARFWANVLIGSTRDLPRRPTIILKANSPGFGDDTNTSSLFKITNPNGYDEDYSMNQVVRGIDLEVQPGNPGAIALYFHGAQGCTVQDVSVRLAADSFACFAGGNGAGGTQLNIACSGGRFGIYFTDSEGSPVVAGALLEGQRESAVVWSR